MKKMLLIFAICNSLTAFAGNLTVYGSSAGAFFYNAQGKSIGNCNSSMGTCPINQNTTGINFNFAHKNVSIDIDPTKSYTLDYRNLDYRNTRASPILTEACTQPPCSQLYP